MESKGQKEPLYASNDAQDDSLYDTGELHSPPYNNQNNQTIDPAERARQQEEWMADLAKLEEEIQTLRGVLSRKVQEASVIKQKLGITAMSEFKEDMKQSLESIKGSTAYQKTSTAVKIVGEKTGTAINNVGAFASRKIGDFRNSNAFKSFEETVGGAYSNGRMTSSKSEGGFEQGSVSEEGGDMNPPPAAAKPTEVKTQEKPL